MGLASLQKELLLHPDANVPQAALIRAAEMEVDKERYDERAIDPEPAAQYLVDMYYEDMEVPNVNQMLEEEEASAAAAAAAEAEKAEEVPSYLIAQFEAQEESRRAYQFYLDLLA